MTTINELTSQATVTGSDQFVLYSTTQGQPRKASIKAISDFMNTQQNGKVNRTGDTMTGPLNVPEGAAGTQVPQAQEVVNLADLASKIDAAKGSGLSGHGGNLNYAVGTIGAVLNHVCINVRMFPWLATGDGVTDDTAAIQAAINSATTGAEIIFPPSIGYKISNNINVPAGVNISGPGKVLRTHGLSVSNYAFTLNGRNTVRGLVYDGGALTIGSPGSPLSIKDFNCINNDIRFLENTFDNSCGSFIGFVNEQYATADTLSELIVQGNQIGNYLDHAIYCQGYSTVDTSNITVMGNNFVGRLATTTRQAVKLKNVRNAAISGNSIDLPNGIFITAETGLDFPVVASDCKDISVSGNTGSCFRFFESVCALDANNTGFMLRNVAITGNTVTVTHYPVLLGLPASGGTSFATRASGVLISGNTFAGPYGININGDMVNYGIDNITIVDNIITINAGTTALTLWGNIIGLQFSGNTCVMNSTYAAANAIWNNDNLVGVSGQTAYIPNVSGVFDISENTLMGNFGCLVAEQPASAVTGLNMTCILRGNRNFGSGASKREVIFQSSVLATATGLFYLENNLSIWGTAGANICAVQALLTGILKVGSGTSGLLVRPNTSDNGVSLYSSNVTPDATNFALQTTGALSILNGTSSSILQVGNSTKLAASAGGIAVTGALAVGAVASTIASAGTIAPTSVIHFVSGTTTISTITPPANMSSSGGLLILIPTGAWALNTAGNIAVASSAVVNKPLILVYDNSGGGKWYPLY